MVSIRQVTGIGIRMLAAFMLCAALVFMTSDPAVFAAERLPARVTPSTSPPAPAILSIIPSQAESGSKVTIFGANFGDHISAYLGSMEIPVKVTDGKQIEFTMPALDAGLYALYLKRGDGAVSRVYNFTVLSLRPVLLSLSPSKISSCSEGAERDVTAQGRNFAENALLFFDGMVIASRVVSSDAITFKVPQTTRGLHQVMVKNSPENASVPLALEIETRPEITQIMVGPEYVNFYELHITGKNFQQNSAVTVDGQQIGGRGGFDLAEREKVVFIDCTKLIYQRYPYSPVTKDFRLQVVNPGGEGSQVVNVSAP